MDYDNDLERTPKDTSLWFAQLADARRGRHAGEDSQDDSFDDHSSSFSDSSVDSNGADEDPTAMEMTAGTGEDAQVGGPPRQGGGGGGIFLFLFLTVVVAGVGFGLGRYGGLGGQQRYEGLTGSLESGG